MVTFGQRHREYQIRWPPSWHLELLSKSWKEQNKEASTTQILPTPNITFLTCFLFFYSYLKLTKKVKSWSMYLFCFLGHNFVFPPRVFLIKIFDITNCSINIHIFTYYLPQLIFSCIFFFTFLFIHPSTQSIGPFFWCIPW